MPAVSEAAVKITMTAQNIESVMKIFRERSKRLGNLRTAHRYLLRFLKKWTGTEFDKEAFRDPNTGAMTGWKKREKFGKKEYRNKILVDSGKMKSAWVLSGPGSVQTANANILRYGVKGNIAKRSEIHRGGIFFDAVEWWDHTYKPTLSQAGYMAAHFEVNWFNKTTEVKVPARPFAYFIGPYGIRQMERILIHYIETGKELETNL